MERFTIMIVITISMVVANSCNSNSKDDDKFIISENAFKALLEVNDNNFKSGTLDNLNKLNGFRDIKFTLLKSEFDLTAFSQIRSTKNPYGVEIFDIVTELSIGDTISKGKFSLFFVNDSLGQIEVEFWRDSDYPYPDSFAINYDEIVELLGEPSIVEREPASMGISVNVSYFWITDDIQLENKYYFPPDRSYCTLIFTKLKYINLFNSYRNYLEFVEDSIIIQNDINEEKLNQIETEKSKRNF